MTKETCDDCGTTRGIVGDLRGTLCSDCMTKRSQEHFAYLENQRKCEKRREVTGQ